MPDTRAVKAQSVAGTVNTNTQSLNINASGSVLVHSEGITLSRSMGDSVALVSGSGASGVSVNSIRDKSIMGEPVRSSEVSLNGIGVGSGLSWGTSNDGLYHGIVIGSPTNSVSSANNQKYCE